MTTRPWPVQPDLGEREKEVFGEDLHGKFDAVDEGPMRRAR
jgi:hypothetical protein